MRLSDVKPGMRLKPIWTVTEVHSDRLELLGPGGEKKIIFSIREGREFDFEPADPPEASAPSQGSHQGESEPVGDPGLPARSPVGDGWWIEWSGGECPVHPDTRVDVGLRNRRWYDNQAGNLRWEHSQPGHRDYDWDIIRYRVQKPATSTSPAQPVSEDTLRLCLLTFIDTGSNLNDNAGVMRGLRAVAPLITAAAREPLEREIAALTERAEKAEAERKQAGTEDDPRIKLFGMAVSLISRVRYSGEVTFENSTLPSALETFMDDVRTAALAEKKARELGAGRDAVQREGRS